MHGKNIRLTKASGKRWIAHHLQAMEKFVGEFDDFATFKYCNVTANILKRLIVLHYSINSIK